MSSLAPTAAQLAATMSSPRVSEYEEVHMLFIIWNDLDSHGLTMLRKLEELCKQWGYGVTKWYADEKAQKDVRLPAEWKRSKSGPPPIPNWYPLDSQSKRPCGLFERFKAWVWEHDDDGYKRVSQRKKLLIPCYIGHANVVQTDLPDSQRWLYAFPDKGDYCFSFTLLEEFARDECAVCDVLFLIETCHGGADGTHNDEGGQYVHWKLCEVLAAVPDGQTADVKDDNAWLIRLAEITSRHFMHGLTARELYDLAHDPTAKGPGHYIQLNLPTCLDDNRMIPEQYGDADGSGNYPDESILLAPLKGSPAAEEAQRLYADLKKDG